MESRYVFRLNFITNLGELMTLNIPHADTNSATSPEVTAAMMAIINSNVVHSVRGEPLTRQSAELVRTERRDFNVLAG